MTRQASRIHLLGLYQLRERCHRTRAWLRSQKALPYQGLQIGEKRPQKVGVANIEGMIPLDVSGTRPFLLQIEFDHLDQSYAEL